MFGIGLPEMIIILAVALIVVGPDKLPGLARSLAKGLMEMKKTLNEVKDNLTQEGEVLDSVQTDLKKTADELKAKMIDVDPAVWHQPPIDPAQEHQEADGSNPPLHESIPPAAETPPAEPNDPAPETIIQPPAAVPEKAPESLASEKHV